MQNYEAYSKMKDLAEYLFPYLVWELDKIEIYKFRNGFNESNSAVEIGIMELIKNLKFKRKDKIEFDILIIPKKKKKIGE